MKARGASRSARPRSAHCRQVINPLTPDTIGGTGYQRERGIAVGLRYRYIVAFRYYIGSVANSLHHSRGKQNRHCLAAS